MIRRIPDDEDTAYDKARQREVDEAREVELAFFEGKDAGRLGTAAALNRYELGTPQAKAWERGRSTIEGEKRAEELHRQRALARLTKAA